MFAILCLLFCAQPLTGQLSDIPDLVAPDRSLTIYYDNLNRLTMVSAGIPVADGGTPVPAEDFAYDGTGNRLSSHLSSLYLSDNHNRLTEDADYTYAYDSKGNRVSRTAKSGGVVEEYTYDSQNRLVKYSSATTNASYTYDAMDRRIAKTVDGVTTAYIYDASSDMGLATDDILLEFDTTSLPAILTRRWAHSDSVDEPLGFESYNASGGPGTGVEHTIFSDRQGSVIWITEPVVGDIVAAYEYDAFGQITQTQGTLQQPYGYTGREFDAESGLYHYRARTYDPATGMFLQSDPIGFKGGDLNTYAYVGNDPFGWGDPSGLIGSTTYRNQAGAAGAHGVYASTVIGGGLIQASAAISRMLMTSLGSPMVDTSNLQHGAGSCPLSLLHALERMKPKSPLGCVFGNNMQMINLQRMRILGRAILMRKAIMMTCFNGGNAGHQQAVAELTIPFNQCYGILTKSWKGK